MGDLNPRLLGVLSLLNDLKAAAFDSFARKHKRPSLLLFIVSSTYARHCRTMDYRKAIGLVLRRA